MRYAVRDYFCPRTDNHSPTRHYPSGTTGCYTNLPLSRLPWELIQFFLEGCRASHHGSKHSLSPTVCLNHTVIHKYLINAEHYLTFSKYFDQLLGVKSLTKILKLTYLIFFFLSFFFFFFFFSDICGLINVDWHVGMQKLLGVAMG